MKNCMTQDKAKKIIEKYAEETNYFSGIIDINDMWDMFKYRYNFGEAETAVILASLVKCGAKFKGNLDGKINIAEEKTYVLGETYWATNSKAGHNMMSSGILIGWTDNGLAILENKRWGKFYATINELNKHN